MKINFFRFVGKTAFIVGGGKNAGKTSFMNLCLNRLRGKTRLAYMSVGCDGENRDNLYGHVKPSVTARRGDMLATSQKCADFSTARFRVLRAYPFSTSLGRMVLLGCERDGDVEIVGPDNNLHLSEILSDMKKLRGETLFIDGAIDRITQIAARRKSEAVYVDRISPENLVSAAAKMKLLFEISSPGAVPPHGAARVRGALTETKLRKALKAAKDLVLDDISKVFISYDSWLEAKKKIRIGFRNRLEISLFVVNLYNISEEYFAREAGLPGGLLGRVIFNAYGHYYEQGNF